VIPCQRKGMQALCVAVALLSITISAAPPPPATTHTTPNTQLTPEVLTASPVEPAWAVLISRLQHEPFSLLSRHTTLLDETEAFTRALLTISSPMAAANTEAVTAVQSGVGMIHHHVVGRLEGVARRLGRAHVSIFDQLTKAVGFHDVPTRAGDHYAADVWREAEQEQLHTTHMGDDGVLTSPAWLGRVSALAITGEQLAIVLSLGCVEVAEVRQLVTQVAEATRDLVSHAIKLAAHCPLSASSCLRSLETPMLLTHLPAFPSSSSPRTNPTAILEDSGWFAKEVSHALGRSLPGQAGLNMQRIAASLAAEGNHDADVTSSSKMMGFEELLSKGANHRFACARTADSLATHVAAVIAIRQAVETF